MPRYQARYVHKISPSPNDISAASVELTLKDLASRSALGAALRRARVLSSGDKISSYRIEGDRVVAFPQASIWHSIILTLRPS